MRKPVAVWLTVIALGGCASVPKDWAQCDALRIATASAKIQTYLASTPDEAGSEVYSSILDAGMIGRVIYRETGQESRYSKNERLYVTAQAMARHAARKSSGAFAYGGLAGAIRSAVALDETYSDSECLLALLHASIADDAGRTGEQ